MKVSSKIIAGFLILMLLAVIVAAYQRSIIHQMQGINRDLSEIDLNKAWTALRTKEVAAEIWEDSRKYFATEDNSVYEHRIAEDRQELLDDIAMLEKSGRSDRERAETKKLADALADYWTLFNRVKATSQNSEDGVVPADLRSAVEHLQDQTEIVYQTVKGSIKDQVARAAEAGGRAEQISWTAGVLSLLLGAIVSFLIFRSINDPLRRLTKGTHAIAKGQFWHRLPAYGRDEFSELARDFNEMTERLGELDQLKKDFVSHVSHDLKAPLASMRQVMHLLLQEIPGTLNEQQRDLLQLSYNSAERLAAMVGNLLDISRMEAGSMEYEMAPHDLVPVVKGVVNEFDVQAREKDIRFKIDCDLAAAFAQCDRDRIVQVIGNLYENALKFSPRNSDIITRIRAGSEEIVLSVSDSGPGVPDEHKNKIFLKFHQVKHGKKMAGQGVGLGLAICKTIVEAHHGQIWVEDNPNGGSIFSFVLKPAASEEVLKCGQTA